MTGLSPPAGTTILVSFITGISSWEVAGRFPRALVLVDTGGGVGACSIGPLYLDLGGTLGGGPRADCVFLILLDAARGTGLRSSSSRQVVGGLWRVWSSDLFPPYCFCYFLPFLS
jgi:hypothetical protein